jgi:Na+/proline symporter
LKTSREREKDLRLQARQLVETHTPQLESNDRDYVFIRFILDYFPAGLIGLLLTTILSAGMSSTASELNALASTTTVDFYKRLIQTGSGSPSDVVASKLFTVMWGLIAIAFASFGSLFENLIQFVNIIGSLFYGTILGVFIAAFLFRRITATAVFIAAILAEGVVLTCFWTTSIGFLWYNVIGCGCVILIGSALSWRKT